MAMAASSYGGQNVMLMRNDLGSSNSLVAMLSSCSPHLGFQMPRSSGGLEDAIAGCGQKRQYGYAAFDGGAMEEPEEDADEDLGFAHPVEKKRRLSFDQVRSLERSFETENKLEPERKLQLAKDLNLQPRQVAVWFQNRRARWKTKQLERDYELLNSTYSKLKSDFDSALREKAALKAEVERLSGKTTTTSCNNQDSQSVEDSSQCNSELAHCSGKGGSVDVCKEKEESAMDSSSELVDADSPRTTALSGLQEELVCEFPAESFVGDAFPVKLEDGWAFQVDPHGSYNPLCWDWA